MAVEANKQNDEAEIQRLLDNGIRALHDSIRASARRKPRVFQTQWLGVFLASAPRITAFVPCKKND